MGEQAGAAILSDAGVGLDQLFAGNDAGGRDFQSGVAGDVRFAGPDGSAVDEAQAFDPVGAAVFGKSGELRFLFGGCGDDEFAGAAVRNVAGGAEFVAETVAGDAVTGLEGAGRIVKAGMEDAAVAGAGGHAEARELFDEEDVVPAGGELGGRGAADDSAADDENVDAVHGGRIARRVASGEWLVTNKKGKSSTQRTRREEREGTEKGRE